MNTIHPFDEYLTHSSTLELETNSISNNDKAHEGIRVHEREKKAMVIWCDNQGAISLTKNPTQHAQTKHIDVQHHFV